MIYEVRQPATSNQQPATRKDEPGTMNDEPETLNLEPFNQQPATSNPLSLKLQRAKPAPGNLS